MPLKNIVLLAITLSGGLAWSAAGQTGRIAHFSHGGSTATLADASDNFGLYMRSFWKADTLVYLNDSTVLHKGLHSSSYYGPPKGGAGWQRRVEEESDFRYHYRQRSTAERLESLRLEYPGAIFSGFEKPRPAVPKKSSGRIQAFPKRPFQYSYWRGLATMAALGAVGWLLGKKRAA